jgi:hypothetical protein
MVDQQFARGAESYAAIERQRRRVDLQYFELGVGQADRAHLSQQPLHQPPADATSAPLRRHAHPSDPAARLTHPHQPDACQLALDRQRHGRIEAHVILAHHLRQPVGCLRHRQVVAGEAEIKCQRDLLQRQRGRRPERDGVHGDAPSR